MIPFSATDDGLVEAEFENEEVDLLVTLASQVGGLLQGVAAPSDDDPLPGLVIGGSETLPDDAALARLLPNAYAEAEASAEFRRLTERGLAGRKQANAQVIVYTARLQTRLDASAALAWMRSLTDMRLVIAARLGIEDDESEVELTDESEAMLAVYDWLGGIQDSLVRAVDR